MELLCNTGLHGLTLPFFFFLQVHCKDTFEYNIWNKTDDHLPRRDVPYKVLSVFSDGFRPRLITVTGMKMLMKVHLGQCVQVRKYFVILILQKRK